MTEHSNRNPIAASAKTVDDVGDQESDEKARSRRTLEVEASRQIARRGRGRYFE